MTYATRLSPISDIRCVARPQVIDGESRRVSERCCRTLRPFGYLYTDQGLRFESKAHAAGVLASIYREIANGAAAADVVRRLLPRDGKQNRVEVHLAQWLKAQAAREAVGELTPTYLRELVRYSRPSGYFSPLLERSIHSLNHGVLEDFWRDLRLGSCSRPGGAWAAAFERPRLTADGGARLDHGALILLLFLLFDRDLDLHMAEIHVV